MPHASQGTILVVDDDHWVAEMIGEALADEGYTAHLAYDGPSALAAIAAELPDLVLADLRMPGMSGLELLHTMRAQDLGDVPVILMTAARGATDLPTQGIAGDHFKVGATACSSAPSSIPLWIRPAARCEFLLRPGKKEAPGLLVRSAPGLKWSPLSPCSCCGFFSKGCDRLFRQSARCRG